MKPEETHNLRIEFGKHKGELFTRLPLSYLRWMVNEGVRDSDVAKAELLRRGSSQLPKIELSNHAIDRASQRSLNRWIEQKADIGFHTWLHDYALKALEEGHVMEKDDDGMSIMFERVKWKFANGLEYPTLLTVIKKKKRKK